MHGLAAAGYDVAFHSVDRATFQQEWAVNSSTSAHLSAPSANRRHLMGFKYVLCLEGNDVATSLKWMMAHNSLVIMPTPTTESWLMEGLLVPWLHYVPLDTPADAPRVLQWARSHDAECLQIVANANAWVQRVLVDFPSPGASVAAAHRLPTRALREALFLNDTRRTTSAFAAPVLAPHPQANISARRSHSVLRAPGPASASSRRQTRGG